MNALKSNTMYKCIWFRNDKKTHLQVDSIQVRTCLNNLNTRMFVLYSNLDLSASLMTTCLYLERKKLADDSFFKF